MCALYPIIPSILCHPCIFVYLPIFLFATCLSNYLYSWQAPPFSGFHSFYQTFIVQLKKPVTIGNHQCGFRRNRSTIDHIFCTRQILEKKWEYSEEVHQFFIDFKKAYDSVRREVLYKILIEFGIPRKLVRLVKMSLTETYSRVQVGKNVSDRFPIRNGLKQGDALSPVLFNLL